MTEAPKHPHLDDSLVKLASHGDRAALEALLEKMAPAALSIASAILPDREDAQDAAQIALNRIAQELSCQWRGGSLIACLYLCVKHASMDLLARSSCQKRWEDEAGKVGAGRTVDVPEAVLERQENLDALREELAALPQEYFLLLALHHLEDLSIAEIAKQLSLTIEACKSRVARARGELKKRLARRGVCLANETILVGMLQEVLANHDPVPAHSKPDPCPRMARVAASSVAAWVAGSPSSLPSQDRSRRDARWPGARTSKAWPAPGRIVRLAGEESKKTNAAPLILFHWLPRMAREHPLSLSGGLLCLAVAVILQLAPWGASEDGQANGFVSNTTQASEGAVEPRALHVENVLGAPLRWQPPRFIRGSYRPLAADVRDLQAVILAKIDRGRHSEELILLRSADGGQTWATGPAFQGISGDVAIAPDGNIQLFLDRGVSKGLLGAVLLTRTGLVTCEMDIKKRNDADWPTELRVLPVAGGFWFFEREDGIGTRILFGRTRQRPEPRITVANSMVIATAWAKNDKSAGIFRDSSDRPDSICYYHTTDGKKWSDAFISCQAPEVASEKNVWSATPLVVARRGDNLTVALGLMKNSFSPFDEDQPSVTPVPVHLLNSRDGGGSWQWSIPLPWRMDACAGPGLAFGGDMLLFCYSRGIRSLWRDSNSGVALKNPWHGNYNTDEALAYALPDTGTSWQRLVSMAPPCATYYSVVAGTTERALLTFRAENGSPHNAKSDPCLVIRTFAAGDWSTEKEPRPAWFKTIEEGETEEDDF